MVDWITTAKSSINSKRAQNAKSAVLGLVLVASAFFGVALQSTPQTALATGFRCAPYSRSQPLSGGQLRSVSNTDQLNTAISAAQPGDVIELADGTYGKIEILLKNGSSGKPITIQARNEGRAKLTGSSGHVLLIRKSSYIDVKGLVMDGQNTTTGSGLRLGSANSTRPTNDDGGASYINISNVTIQNLGQEGFSAKGRFDGTDPSHHVSFTCGVIKNTGQRTTPCNPNSTNYCGEGVYIGNGGTGQDTSHDILIQGNKIHGIYGAQAIEAKAKTYNVSILDNHIYDVDVSNGGAVVVSVNSTNYRNGNYLIEGNRIHDVRTISKYSDANGISVGHGTTTVRNNVIWDTDNRGIIIFNGREDLGFGNPSATDVFVYNNTFFGCGSGFGKECIGLLGGNGNGIKPTLNIANNLGDFSTSGADEAMTSARDRSASSNDFVGPLTGFADSGDGPGSGFILKNTSGAANSARTISGFSNDLLGGSRPTASAWDYGAFERGATVSNSPAPTTPPQAPEEPAPTPEPAEEPQDEPVPAEEPEIQPACDTKTPLRLTVSANSKDSFYGWLLVSLPEGADPVIDARLEVEGECRGVDEITSNSWTWIKADGTLPLKGGEQETQLHLPTGQVLLDKVLFTQSKDCIPEGNGANCVSQEVTITLNEVLQDRVVNGNVDIEAVLSSEQSDAKVTFFIDEDTTPISTQQFAPYCLVNGSDDSDSCGLWDSTSVEDGERTLTARVEIGNQATETIQTFTVANTPETRQAPTQQKVVQAPAKDDTPTDKGSTADSPVVKATSAPEETIIGDAPVVVLPTLIPSDDPIPSSYPLESDIDASSSLSDEDRDAVQQEPTRSGPNTTINTEPGAGGNSEEFKIVLLPISAVIIGESTTGGRTVSGTLSMAVPLELIVDGVTEIQYFIDGEFIGKASSEEPVFKVDSSDYSNGSYVLGATIIYDDGQEANMQSTITIQNDASSFVAAAGQNLLLTGIFVIGTLVYLYALALFVYKRFFYNKSDQPDVFDTTDPYPRAPTKENWFVSLPGKIIRPVQSQYVARPAMVLTIGGFVLMNGFVFGAPILISQPIYVGNLGFIVEPETTRIDSVHSLRTTETDGATRTFAQVLANAAPNPQKPILEDSTPPLTREEPESVEAPEIAPPEIDGAVDPRLVAPAVIRNTKLDNSLFLDTASVALPRSEFTTSSSLTVDEPEGDKAGNFRIDCYFSHLGYADPVASPNGEFESRLNTFFGNTRTSQYSTDESIQNFGSSSCDGFELNRSAYWLPTAFDANGNARIPSWMRVYYKAHGNEAAISQTKAAEAGHKMVAGNANANKAQDTLIASWKCGSENAAPSSTIPKCAENERLIAHVRFPYCWDGKSTDSDNHKRHMAYPEGGDYYSGNCPDTHQVKLQAIEFLVNWERHDGDTDNWFISSDVRADGTKVDNGSTLHATWWNGWNTEIHQQIVAECNAVVIDCQTSLLGVTKESLLPQDETNTIYAPRNSQIFVDRTNLQAICPRENFNAATSAAFCGR